MDDSDSASPRIRRDGWTAERQLRFLAALAETASVSAAAAAAGMSRESAYRLRTRKQGALFAAAWDRALDGHDLARPVRRRAMRARSISRENPPKVTKRKKWKDPRFNAFEQLLRELREPVQCPAPRPATEENRACSAGRGFRASTKPSE